MQLLLSLDYGWRKGYGVLCNSIGRPPPLFPASSSTNELFVVNLIENNFKLSTIRSGVAAIAFVHKKFIYADPSTSFKLS